jgi:hypothetical protein
MAKIEEQVVSLAGVGPAYSAAAGGGDTFDPDEDTFIHVKNGHSSPQTVTIATPRTDPGTGQPEADIAVAVPNGGERMIGPFPHEVFADPTTGLASLTYSGVTALTLAVLKVPRH